MSELIEFESYRKIPRLRKGCIITEKLDGTNAQIYFPEDPEHEGSVMYVGSRNRWITPEADNFGFARWAYEHKNELRLLGRGRHFGEWWGQGVGRRYGLTEKRFTLFNTARPVETLPTCVSGVVPVLYDGDFSDNAVQDTLDKLKRDGSVAAPGFMNPEGVVVYMKSSGELYKITYEDTHKEQRGPV